MRDTLSIICGFAAALVTAFLFASGIESLPDVGPVLFVYVALGILCTVLAFIGVAKVIGGR